MRSSLQGLGESATLVVSPHLRDTGEAPALLAAQILDDGLGLFQHCKGSSSHKWLIIFLYNFKAHFFLLSF